MLYPISVSMPNGAVSLGPDVVCDGFLSRARARVQTHVHSDHMHDFATSKGNQLVLTSEPTRALLVAMFDADLPYRNNVKSMTPSETYTVGTSRIDIVPSGHMLGAVQVLVEIDDGTRLGYSGDFSWPLNEVIEVDALVVDSTNGAPENVRQYSQGECEEQLVETLRRFVTRGPVFVRAWRGTLQRALQVIHDEIGLPVICSDRLFNELNVYTQFGYSMGPLVPASSPTTPELIREDRYIHVYSTGDETPVDYATGSKITLSAYDSRTENPMTVHSDRSVLIAMSNHADFDGVLEYVASTKAKYVLTDNSRNGRGYDLAIAIRQRLGIEADPSSHSVSRGWGT